VDIDRQAIERRDFPISRRGYDTAAVDTHLRALAAEFEELQNAPIGAEPSLASTASTQVQSILSAAETAAADIERQAAQGAAETREQADRDAARTREEAIAQARDHVAAVSAATAVLLERVSSMDGEVSTLVESLRAGAGRLAGDLAAVETNMGELYDAASGEATGAGPARQTAPGAPPPMLQAVPSPPAEATPSPGPPIPALAPPVAAPAPAFQAAAEATPAPAPRATSASTAADLDGARLIALNMALNGEPRAAANRYLAENFKLEDREKLIDEVYAAIEG
jgi:F0F1-type ATP synthase membrane subunit b/b'